MLHVPCRNSISDEKEGPLCGYPPQDHKGHLPISLSQPNLCLDSTFLHRNTLPALITHSLQVSPSHQNLGGILGLPV